MAATKHVVFVVTEDMNGYTRVVGAAPNMAGARQVIEDALVFFGFDKGWDTYEVREGPFSVRVHPVYDEAVDTRQRGLPVWTVKQVTLTVPDPEVVIEVDERTFGIDMVPVTVEV